VTEYLDRPAGEMPAGYAAVYDDTSFWSSRFGAILLDEIDLRPVNAGLDVACGTGFPLIELAQMHGPSSQWIGIDSWNDAVVRARQKIAARGVTNAIVEEGDASAMPFADASFDLITCNLGVNNFSDPAAVVRECARVARAGARFAIATNITGHMAEVYELLRTIMRDAGLGDRIAALDAQEAHRGTYFGIETMLRDAGFEVARHVRRDFPLRYVDGSAMLRHSLVKWFLDGWREVIGAPREREVFAKLEQRLNDRAPLELMIPALYVEGVRV
jgi:ubiquinone/menaquinone biosynthesis C-methylase UbiE